MASNSRTLVLAQYGQERLSMGIVGGKQKGAKSGKGGVNRKTLSPRFSPHFRNRAAV